MQQLLLRPRLVRAVTVTGLLLLTAWVLSPRAGADRFPPDPVESLRLYLRQDEKAARTPEVEAERKAILEKKAAAIRSLGDLARALTLQEWGGKGLDPDLNEIWTSLANRFERDGKEALLKGDASVRQATARLLSELSTQARRGGVETQRVAGRLPPFAPELIALTGSDDPAVAVAAIGALGRIHPDPQKAVPALERVLASGSVGLRRAAAEALLNMIQVAAEVVKKVQGEEDRDKAQKHQVQADRAAFLAALGGVGDSDSLVRRYSLDAMQQAAVSLEDRIIIPPPDTLNFPPPERKVWAEEERKRAKVYVEGDPEAKIKGVRAESAELQPLLDVLPQGSQFLARALFDPDPEVRLRARLAAAEIAYARQKMKQWLATIPKIPPEAPKPKDEDKKDDKKEEKKDGAARGADGPAGAVRLVRAEEPAAEGPKGAGRRDFREDLSRAIFDHDVRNRLAAIDAIEDLGPDAAAAAPALVKALDDPDRFVRWAAARTLGKLAPADAGPAVRGLIKLLCYPDLDVRLAAVTALAAYGPLAADAVPALAKAVVSKDDDDMRVGAIRALDAIGTEAAPAIPALIDALSQGTDRVRRAAAVLLGKFGPVARSALPALRRALNDRDADVRRYASDAILNIERQ
jgi:HEAT repeat protein